MNISERSFAHCHESFMAFVENIASLIEVLLHRPEATD